MSHLLTQRPLILSAVLALLVAVPVRAATAQGAKPDGGVPNAVQGFSQNQGKPIQIESATLEVRDKDKIATFAGDVHVVQGDTDMRCKSLIVYYDEFASPAKGAAKPAAARPAAGKAASATPAATAAAPAGVPPKQQQTIKRLEAKGDVVVVQKEQTATGNSGIYDIRTSTITLSGNVTLTQGPNVVRGERLTVNVKSGVSRMEEGKSGQGVRALFQSGPQPAGAPSLSAPKAEGNAEPKGTSSRPVRMN